MSNDSREKETTDPVESLEETSSPEISSEISSELVTSSDSEVLDKHLREIVWDPEKDDYCDIMIETLIMSLIIPVTVGVIRYIAVY